MLNFFITILLSLNAITVEEAPKLSEEEVNDMMEIHAPEYMSEDWDWSDKV